MFDIAPCRLLRSLWLAAPLSAAVAVAQASAQNVAASGQSVEAGARVFQASGCGDCHAVNGLGGGVGPDLALLAGPRSFYDLAAAMWNHEPEMRRRMDARHSRPPSLEPWEAADLIAFLFWLDYFDPPGDTARGAALFQRKGCIRCHQVRGLGGARGPDLGALGMSRTPIMLAAGMWNHAPAMATAMRTERISRPGFTGSELRDLLAFLRGVNAALPSVSLYVTPGEAERGRELFRSRGCVGCHSAGGEGGTLAADLGARRYASVLDFAAGMWNKGPRMLAAMAARGASVPVLQADEMADLVAYFYEARLFRETGAAQRGAAVVGSRKCRQCHGAGGDAAPDLGRVRGLDSPAAVVAALWNHVALPGGLSTPGRGGWPALTAREVADVAAYFQRVERVR